MVFHVVKNASMLHCGYILTGKEIHTCIAPWPLLQSTPYLHYIYSYLPGRESHTQNLIETALAIPATKALIFYFFLQRSQGLKIIIVMFLCHNCCYIMCI